MASVVSAFHILVWFTACNHYTGAGPGHLLSVGTLVLQRRQTSASTASAFAAACESSHSYAKHARTQPEQRVRHESWCVANCDMQPAVYNRPSRSGALLRSSEKTPLDVERWQIDPAY